MTAVVGNSSEFFAVGVGKTVDRDPDGNMPERGRCPKELAR